MPLHGIDNWIRHDLVKDRCSKCGIEFPQAKGLPVVYSKRNGWLYVGVPTTKVEPCNAHN